MKLKESTKNKLIKVSKSCPNCANKLMAVVPDVVSLKHESGFVDCASTICPKCAYQTLFNIDILDKLNP